MAKKVLILATNYGSWGEELQAPWDIIKKAGHEVTLATPRGKKPLPLSVSCDPEFFDPVIKFHTNPPEVCQRIKELVDGEEWTRAIRYEDATMADYDAIALTGGLGAMLDMCNNYYAHKLIMEAFNSNKLIAALCYSVSTLVFCRNPLNDGRSIVWGKEIAAHPEKWDFYGPGFDFAYDLYGQTPDNKMTDVHTPGFLWPLEPLVRDAVGPEGKCVANSWANREHPTVVYDWPFLTGTSVESSIEYGKKIVEVLATR